MYEKIKSINGKHPWRKISPDGYVDYPVRLRKGGRVIYFNYKLAKELKLIPSNHPLKLNAELEETLLNTFSLQIINEYDWINKQRFPDDGLRDRLYMATRYLQTQHENKKGGTSGDGRSIWNGIIRTKSKLYDVSSCGTGTTMLSPGIQEAKKWIETGSNAVGYASGLAELDEMLSGAIMSEIFYRKGLPTERCLCVIEYNDKTAIGVRVAPNLTRPAHFFRYLKTGDYDNLKAAWDYFINREVRNRVWKLSNSDKTRYKEVLDQLTIIYAKLAAVLEEEYIFNWLSWDGDNLLANGSILDYGSIRQFSAKHNKYRYEDVDRYSTSLTEQKYWARKIVQTFIQLVDFVLTKEKKPIDQFANHPKLEEFDSVFDSHLQYMMLWRVGFTDKQIKDLTENHQEEVDQFKKVINYFEHVKTAEGQVEVPDGINHRPVFLVRRILKQLPEYLLNNYDGKKWPTMPGVLFCSIMAASYVEDEDLKFNNYRQSKVVEFQEYYLKLIKAVSPKVKTILKGVLKRSEVINYELRSTGDALTWIVNEAIKVKDHLDQEELQLAMNRFIESQVIIPGRWKPIRDSELQGRSKLAQLLNKMQENLELYSESI